MPPPDPTHRPIVACRIENDGAGTVHLRVYCPRAGASVPLETCETCAAHIELPEGQQGGVVVCGPEGEAACERLSEAPPIGALVTAPLRAIRDNAPLTAAVTLLAAAGAEPVLVVDASGRCVGALSRTQMVRLAPRAALPGGGQARDAMAEATVAVETSSVRDALRTMAAHRLRHIAIVAEDGTPLGSISDVEALRLHTALRG